MSKLERYTEEEAISMIRDKFRFTSPIEEPSDTYVLTDDGFKPLVRNVIIEMEDGTLLKRACHDPTCFCDECDRPNPKNVYP